MDLVETEDDFVLRADLPGMAEDDVTIELEDNVLTVSGERKAEHEEQAGGLLPRGARVRRFSRSLTLPKGVDPEASRRAFDNGVLEVRIPKPEQRKPRKIRIGGAQRRAATHRGLSRGLSRPASRARCGGPLCFATARLGAVVRDPHARPRLARPRRHARTRPRRGPHAGVRPARDQGGGQDARGREVAALGYDMVLGNTFHLFLAPGHELDRALRRPARVHALGRADRSPTRAASRSSRWATARSPTRSRAAPPRGPSARGAILAIEEEGVRFRSYVDGSERFMGPETSMEVQAALGSDIALVFDECTPFHVTRDYTARSTERTHRWLDRCLDWHAEHGPERPARLRHRAGRRGRGPARWSARRRSPRAARSGIAIGGSLGRGQGRRCTRSSAGRPTELPERAPAPPARDRRRRRPAARRRARHRHVRLRDADAPRPPRHGARARPRAALARRPRQGPLPRLATSR